MSIVVNRRFRSLTHTSYVPEWHFYSDGRDSALAASFDSGALPQPKNWL